MKLTKKRILLISAIVTLPFVSKTVLNNNSKVSANDSAQYVQSVKVTKFDEGLNNVKNSLPASFKNKVKMPNDLPFKIKHIAASKLDLSSGNTIDQTFIGENGELVEVLVEEVPSIINYSNDFGEEPVNITLKDGNQATFFKNSAAVQLTWIDKITGFQYTIVLNRIKQIKDEDLKNEMISYHIDTLEKIYSSLTNIN